LQVLWDCGRVQISGKDADAKITTKKLSSGNTCYHAFQNIVFPSATENIKIKVQFYLLFCSGLKMVSHVKGRTQMGVLRRIFGTKRGKVTGGRREFMMRSFIIALFTKCY
jgi:hypothetical protein